MFPCQWESTCQWPEIEDADVSIIGDGKVASTVIGYACRLPAQSLLDHAKGRARSGLKDLVLH